MPANGSRDLIRRLKINRIVRILKLFEGFGVHCSRRCLALTSSWPV